MKKVTVVIAEFVLVVSIAGTAGYEVATHNGTPVKPEVEMQVVPTPPPADGTTPVTAGPNERAAQAAEAYRAQQEIQMQQERTQQDVAKLQYCVSQMQTGHVSHC